MFSYWSDVFIKCKLKIFISNRTKELNELFCETWVLFFSNKNVVH